jgi:hypothetical protein
MRITITPVSTSSSVTPFVLVDDAIAGLNGTSFFNGAGGQCKDGFLPEMTVETQRDALINAAYLQELPRGNAQMTYTFQTLRIFATTDQTLMFLRDHPGLVPLTGTLAVTIAATTAYLKNAVLKRVRAVECSGLATVFSYSYSGSYVPPVAGSAGTGAGGPFTPS